MSAPSATTSPKSTLERLKAGLLNRGTAPAAAAPGAAAAGAAVTPPKPVRITPEHYEFDKFPEYRDYTTMNWYFGQQKYEQTQFREHLGASGANVVIAGREMVNFSSYNYLGLSGDPRVNAAAKQAIDNFGTSASASRMLTGEIPLHGEFEREVAAVLGCEDAVVSVGGYSTIAFTIAHICRRQDLILYDELMHNSALMGCKLSGARRFPFPHNDLDALEALLREHRGFHERVLIVVEGVYSMDGDLADVPKLIEIKRRHKALLLVDEAHSMGVIGPRGLGVTDYFGIPGSDIDLLYGTMSKSFASSGGFVAGSKALVAMLKYYAAGVQLYSAAPVPANVAAALAALRIMVAEPERAQALQRISDHFRRRAVEAGLDIAHSKDSAIVPVMLADSELALWLSVKLFEENICVYPMLYPIVPRNAVRLRFFLTCQHTVAQVDHAIARLVALRGVAPKSKGVI